ncbi:hypothetical protein SAMN02745181_3204 [Rubritalea squalenifaciens DSM 18772]|uniref:Uncharacterized protein n=1 Tax=Rubritalea squalenifaciens DSM 18772 TaxID=1123071 RepID=A0A1M6PIU1_9BACT|nr:ankyrin repeat domain-containing protein [Rubritalea squalenifaciens]SHK07885.1 hypothetical protein SAMN02745181_3204 [Rubritalea squalenifaciens DSM 18772]
MTHRSLHITRLLLTLLILSPVLGHAQSLKREEALAIGQKNDGLNDGVFWYTNGEDSPPFTHIAQFYVEPYTENEIKLKGSDQPVRLHGGYEDEKRIRVDLFTASNGNGWITIHITPREIITSGPKERDDRDPIHKELSPAALVAFDHEDLDLLATLIKRGLKVNEAVDFESGDTLLHLAAISSNAKWVKFLLKNGADPEIWDRHGYLPITNLLTHSDGDAADKAVCELLAKAGDEKVIETYPTGLIASVLPHNSPEIIYFIAWNGQDPSPAILKEIRKTLPQARPASRMETLKQRPRGAHSWYQDKQSQEFGTLVDIKLSKDGESWKTTVRVTVGPAMAGGGCSADMHKAYGYWYPKNKEGWEE